MWLFRPLSSGEDSSKGRWIRFKDFSLGLMFGLNLHVFLIFLSSFLIYFLIL
jgi:hypothetical protein